MLIFEKFMVHKISIYAIYFDIRIVYKKKRGTFQRESYMNTSS